MIIKSGEVQKLTSKYIAVIPDHYYNLLEAVMLGIKKSVEIPQTEIDKWEIELQKRNQFNELLSKTAELNNLGIAAEKNNKIDEAINYYEENIKAGYLATHSFTRLMIIYHKRKQYQDEIRIIDRAIEIFNREADTVQKWIVRRGKAAALLNRIT